MRVNGTNSERNICSFCAFGSFVWKTRIMDFEKLGDKIDIYRRERRRGRLRGGGSRVRASISIPLVLVLCSALLFLQQHDETHRALPGRLLRRRCRLGSAWSSAHSCCREYAARVCFPHQSPAIGSCPGLGTTPVCALLGSGPDGSCPLARALSVTGGLRRRNPDNSYQRKRDMNASLKMMPPQRLYYS